MSMALVVIATGDAYRQHAKNLIASAKQFFVPHDVALFTDKPPEFDVPVKFDWEHLGYPRATLMRYHAIWGARETLSKYDHVFYSDADILFIAPVAGEEVFSEGITATEHPGYVGLGGTPETNPRSAAYCPSVRTYFCGGFNGGTSTPFLQMAEAISKAVDADDANGVLAVWHDESHLNRYLHDHPPARILSPSFCYPQGEYESGHGNGYYGGIWRRAGRTGIVPKLVALEKGKR
jgi:histo-blood group ABO system transferase